MDLTEISGHDTATLARIGVKLTGSPDCIIAVSDPSASLQGVNLSASPGCRFVFGGARPHHFYVNITAAPDCQVIMPELPGEFLILENVNLRAPGQSLSWGRGSSAVGLKIELEGIGAALSVGDDCMVSSGIWIRNYDMHTIFDTETCAILNHATLEMMIEAHVWLGIESCVLGAGRIGYGSIVGARSMVTGNIPPKSLAVGTPARVIRSGVSWARNVDDVPAATLARLAGLDQP